MPRELPVQGVIDMPPGVTSADVLITYLSVIRGSGVITGGQIRTVADASGEMKADGQALRMVTVDEGEFADSHPYARFEVSFRGQVGGYEFRSSLVVAPTDTLLKIHRVTDGQAVVKSASLTSLKAAEDAAIAAAENANTIAQNAQQIANNLANVDQNVSNALADTAQAINDAEDATEAANIAAEGANTAKDAAESATAGANAARDDATSAAQNAQQAADDLQDAADGVDSAVLAANQAAQSAEQAITDFSALSGLKRFADDAAREADTGSDAGTWAATITDNGSIVYHEWDGAAWQQKSLAMQPQALRVINAEASLNADGTSDDGPALQAFFTANANGQRGIGIALQAGRYYSSVNLKLPNPSYQFWDFTGVEIIFDSNLSGILFEIGDSGSNTIVYDTEIKLPAITRDLSSGDYTSVPDRADASAITGLRSTNIYHSKLTEIDVSYCSIGFEPYGTAGRGNVYNTYEVRQLFNNRVSLRPNAATNGWSNENIYLGGRWWNNWWSALAQAAAIGDTEVQVVYAGAFKVGSKIRINPSQGIEYQTSETYTITAIDESSKTLTLDRPLTTAHSINQKIASNMCESHIILPDGFSCNRNLFIKPSLEGAGENCVRMIAGANVMDSPRTEMYTLGGECRHLDGEHADVAEFPVYSIAVNPGSASNRVQLDYWSGTVDYYDSPNDNGGGGHTLNTNSSYIKNLRFVSDLVPTNLPQYRIERGSNIQNHTPLLLLRDKNTSGKDQHLLRAEFARNIGTSQTVAKEGADYDFYSREHYVSITTDIYSSSATRSRAHIITPANDVLPTSRYRSRNLGTTQPLSDGDRHTDSQGRTHAYDLARGVFTNKFRFPLEAPIYTLATRPDATKYPFGEIYVSDPASGEPNKMFSDGADWQYANATREVIKTIISENADFIGQRAIVGSKLYYAIATGSNDPDDDWKEAGGGSDGQILEFTTAYFTRPAISPNEVIRIYNSTCTGIKSTDKIIHIESSQNAPDMLQVIGSPSTDKVDIIYYSMAPSEVQETFSVRATVTVFRAGV